MKNTTKVCIALLLFVHLLVHPTLHGFPSCLGHTTPYVTDLQNNTMDECAVCRVASAMVVAETAPAVDWHPVVVQILHVSSPRVVASPTHPHAPSRAPPTC